MSMRSIRMPDDIETVECIVYESFQYPENPEWDVREDERENIPSQASTIEEVVYNAGVSEYILAAGP